MASTRGSGGGGGALPLLIALLGGGKAQEAAAHAIAKLALNNEANQAEVTQLGGIPKLIALLKQLKGARGVTIISTAVEGELIKSASTQMRIERKLRQQRDEQNIRGFTQVVITHR